MNAKVLYTWDDKLPMRRKLPYDVTFTFGSNQRGRHGAGAAEFARKYFGAVEGIGEGYAGQSYAIPTKDVYIQRRALSDIAPAVQRFRDFARLHNRLKFFITPIGCGLAGYKPVDIAPLFGELSSNCAIPLSWTCFFPGYSFHDSEV